MPKPAVTLKKERYKLQSVLGKGGMGVVYKAYDTATEREVTLKTIHDVNDRAALDLFKQEYSRQKSLTHPNIVDIFDIGEMEEGGEKRPFFTMPLLRGATLDDLIKNSSHRLTVERVIDITCGVCKGLQAAHDSGLIHRDIKPSNIFVLEDDSVKIIDFGISHLMGKNTTVGFKGTPLYMSPEQVLSQKLTPLSDIFSLAAVCYEALTRRRAFETATREGILDSILHRIPVPACELNPAVNWPLSQVLHAAMAKEPFRRFASAKEFAEALLKALRGEPIERFNPARIQPRIERARKAFEEGDCDFAAEILAELESECWIGPDVVALQREVTLVRRERESRRLLAAAEQRAKNEEYPLALQKVEEVLRLDPQHPEALAMRDRIEAQHRSQKIAGWFTLARRHIENHSYDQARQAVQSVLQADPNDSTATRMLAEIDRQEQEHLRQRQLKEQLYQNALEDWQRGDVTNALSKLDRLMELDRTSPEHQSLYNQVRSAHDQLRAAYEQARQHLETRNFAAALDTCNQALKKYPQNALFQALKFDAEAGQRQELSGYIAQVDRDVEKEPDIDRKVAILESALERFPIDHFRQSLNLLRAKRELVNSILEKARAFEAKGHLGEAIGQLEILRNIDSQHPGLMFEIERLQKRREQQTRSEAKMRVVEQIDRLLQDCEYKQAAELATRALTDYPADSELAALLSLARQGMERSRESLAELEKGRRLIAAGQSEEALQCLRRAYKLDERNSAIRSVLVEQLLVRARSLVDSDWRAADVLVREATSIDPGNSAAKSFRRMIQDHERLEFVNLCTSNARTCQAAGDHAAAIAHVDRGLERYPEEQRLLQLRAALQATVPQAPPPAAAPTPETVQRTRVYDDAPAPQPAPPPEPPSAQQAADVEPPPPERLEAPRAAAAPSFQHRALKALTTVGAAVLLGLFWLVAKIKYVAVNAAAGVIFVGVWVAHRIRGAKVPEVARGAKPFAAVAKPSVLISAFVVLGLIVLGVSALIKMRPKVVEAPPNQVRLLVETSPVGAALFVDEAPADASSILVTPGKHTIRATLDGYQTAQAEVDVKSGGTAPIHLILRPYAPALRIMGDLGKGSATLDGQPAGEIVDGQFAMNAVTGPKQLKITGDPGTEFTLGFDAAEGKQPQLIDPPMQAKQLQAVVVLSYRGKARVYCSFAPAKLSVNEQAIGEVPAAGLDITLQPGAYSFVFGEGKAQRSFPVEIGTAPSIITTLSSDRNIGHLEIASNEAQFRLLVDGKDRKYSARNDKFYVWGLDVKGYTLRAEKEGFTVVPDQVPLQITKGQIQKVEFKFTPIPVLGTLEIAGGPTDAEIIIDGEPQRLTPEGGVSIRVKPGKHTVTVRKKDFHPWTRDYEVAAGATAAVRGSDIKLERILTAGRVEVRIDPNYTRVTYRPSSGGAERPIPGASFELPAGSYVFHANAPEYQDQTETIQVKAGATVLVTFNLKKVVRQITSYGMDSWESQAGWVNQGGWQHAKGKDFVLYPPKPAGTLDLDVWNEKRVRWVVNFKSPRDYEEFTLTDKKLEWRLVVNGKDARKEDQSHGVNYGKQFYRLRLRINGNQLTQQLWDSSARAYRDLPLLRSVGADLTEGKFGFHLDNNGILLQNFVFRPQQ